MKIWVYDLGKWIEDGYEIEEWKDEEEHEDFIKDRGFELWSRKELGEEFSNNIIFYEDELGLKRLAEIPTNNSSFYFFIPNYPSYIMYLKEYGQLYKKPNQDFVEAEDQICINKKYIVSAQRMYSSSSEAVYLEVEGIDTRVIAGSWKHKENKDGKKICAGKAREWMKENLGID